MDIKKIEQYRATKNEIKMLENQIKNLSMQNNQYASDVVSGSSSSFPYIKRTFAISGYDTNHDKISRKRYRIQELNKDIDEIEAFVESILDSEIRQIIQYKFFDGMTWRKVARLMNYSKSGAYDKFYRYIEKCGQNGQIV